METLTEETSTNKLVEGRDIKVCIRSRPLNERELSEDCFEILHSQPATIHFMEPKLTVKEKPKLEPVSYTVDHAFGPKDNNDMIYNSIMGPLIDLSFGGGMSSIFAHGQTGTGKTYTMQGLLDRIPHDLMKR